MIEDCDEIAALRLALADARKLNDEALLRIKRLDEAREAESREDQHRLRNIFSLIRTLSRLTGEDAETVQKYRDTLDGRLGAYLRVQTAARNWHEGVDLAQMLADECLTFNLKEGTGLELAGPSVSLTSRAAGLLALMFHELACGTIQPLPFTPEDISISVRWRVGNPEPAGLLVIDWMSRIPEVDYDGTILSSWVVWVSQAINHQLAGTLHTDMVNSQTHVRLTLPVTVIYRS